MFKSRPANPIRLNRAVYRDKVLGCWTGKNIGGTLGAPFEWSHELNDVTYYTQDLQGKPVPNDDLDLQLVWLCAVEDNGIYNLNERILGEYWLDRITAAWNEYGVCRANLRLGLTPPLSGSCNNERWKNSNGAWIRSEIWACLFPGAPDEAARYAYRDACCDHTGEGIYAEVFTAVLQSSAFVVNDVRSLIELGLASIPEHSLVARSIRAACSLRDRNLPFRQAREEIVAINADTGYFQAPQNLGFMMLGLLYGDGDFEKTVTLAVNCGDDADCTAGTAAAILGIMLGRSGIPEKWCTPIGDSIRTCTIDTYADHRIPETLDELTDRVVAVAEKAAFGNVFIPQFTDGKNVIPVDIFQTLSDAGNDRLGQLLGNKPFEFAFDLPFGRLLCDYGREPYFEEGKAFHLSFGFITALADALPVTISLELPDGWRTEHGSDCVVNAKYFYDSRAEITVLPGTSREKFVYVPVTIKSSDRALPYSLFLPFQNGTALDFAPEDFPIRDAYERVERIHTPRRSVQAQ